MYVYQFALKINPELMQTIQDLAKREQRSTNKQIEYMLEQYLRVIQPQIDKAISEAKPE